MSALMDIVKARHSVRNFDKKEVDPRDISSMVEAARWAPSACNKQPWRFIAVTDPGLRASFTSECLGDVVPNRWAGDAKAFLVACAEKTLLTHTLGETVSGIPYHMIDLGIALEHAVLRAVELGLGTCYIGWFKPRSISRLLNIPRKWKVACLLAIGYPKEEAGPRTRLPLEKILHFNRFENQPKEKSSSSGACNGSYPWLEA